MSVPGIVQSTLNGEEIAARVSLGSEDEIFITPSSTLVYRSDGLLSDESVDEYPHEADRLTLSEGRRKTKFTLEYPLEGTRSFTVPSSKTDAVLHPVLAGVLNGNGITDPGETVVQTYRFSELTLIITSDRLVKHIGAAVWDGDYEEYHFGDVTNLDFEDGSVATQIVLTANGRPQRIKAPNEEANDLRERLKRALFEYHDVGSLEELNAAVGIDDDDETDRNHGSVDFGESVDPLDANPPTPDDAESNSETPRDVSETADSHSQSTDPLADATDSTDPLADPAGQIEDEPTATDPEASAVQDQQDSRQAHHNQQSDQQTDTQHASQGRGQTEPQSDRDNTTATHEDDTTFEMTSETATESPPDTERSEAAESAGRDQTNRAATTDSAPLLEPDTDQPTESEPDVADLHERIESLETAVDRQNELLERQQQTIEQLISELQKGR